MLDAIFSTDCYGFMNLGKPFLSTDSMTACLQNGIER